MSKKIKGRPEELDFDAFFADNRVNQFHGTYPSGLKVPDRPEIIFPKSSYDPIVGAQIKGLSDSSPTGSLRVNTNPGDGEFFIVDGQGNEISFGKAPVTVTDVDVGSYAYVVKLEGYQDYRESIQINQGMICCLTVDLEVQEKKEQCQAIPPPGPTIPTSVPGYVVMKERDLTYIVAGLALLAGIIIGYWLLKRKD